MSNSYVVRWKKKLELLFITNSITRYLNVDNYGKTYISLGGHPGINDNLVGWGYSPRPCFFWAGCGQGLANKRIAPVFGEERMKNPDRLQKD
jgi:hypothetical protein